MGQQVGLQKNNTDIIYIYQSSYNIFISEEENKPGGYTGTGGVGENNGNDRQKKNSVEGVPVHIVSQCFYLWRGLCDRDTDETEVCR